MLTVGPEYSSKFSDEETAQLAEQLEAPMPRDGVVRDGDAAKIYQHVFCRLVQTTAGSEAELLHLGACPFGSG